MEAMRISTLLQLLSVRLSAANNGPSFAFILIVKMFKYSSMRLEWMTNRKRFSSAKVFSSLTRRRYATVLGLEENIDDCNHISRP